MGTLNKTLYLLVISTNSNTVMHITLCSIKNQKGFKFPNMPYKVTLPLMPYKITLPN